MDWIFWLILVIALAIIELVTVNLLTIWFCFSGIVALILSFYIDNVAI
ncbi:MAG TPA: NfeD family protein, partial [Candidatus Onthocola stercoravium]|nr:NfeD family protein [Candidatus Onthocola stercoravium]